MKNYADGKMILGVLPVEESAVEEIVFHDKKINAKAKKLASLLK